MAFLSCYIRQGIFRSEDRCIATATWNKDIESRKYFLEQCVVNLATKCVIDIRFKGLQSSSIAAAIVFHVRRCHAIEPMWSENLTSICLHDPFKSKQVEKVLVLFETAYLLVDAECADHHQQQNVSSLDGLTSQFAAVDLQASSRPLTTEGVHLFVTPDHNNKENSKPLKEISPVAIASMEFLS
jgi:hypothetical protein